MNRDRMINRASAIVSFFFPAIAEVTVSGSVWITFFCGTMVLIAVINNTLYISTSHWTIDSLAAITILCVAAIVILLLVGAPFHLVQGVFCGLLFGVLFVGCQWAAAVLWRA